MNSITPALADFDTCARQVRSICRPWQLESLQRRSFRGRVRNFTVASLNVTELALGRSRMQAQPVAGTAGARYYSLLMQIRGCAKVCSEQGAAQLREGDIILLDSTSATAVESSDATLQYALNFFRPEDVARLDVARSRAGRPLTCNSGAAALLRDTLGSVVRNATTLESLDLRHHAIDLLLAAFEGAHGALVCDNPCRSASMDLLVRHIDSQLEDPMLCPRTLARALRISLRALYRITAAQGVTPAGLIWSRRLQMARRRLDSSEPGSITSIAYESGFKDSGHFSRAFRKAFGEAPSAMRRGVQRVAAGGQPRSREDT
jgi:AraC-like DNA-binding protein